MPPFHSLEGSQVEAVVSYLRTLQGAESTVDLPGDPERGKSIFFGKARCSDCHMIAGQGGFIASDLSGYGRTHAIEQIQNAIVKPDSGADRQSRLVTATVRSGKKYVGRIRNEDNFSLQLQALDGTFRFLSKSDLKKLEYNTETLMPSGYGSTLTSGELNDLISYLISIANAAPEASGKDDEE